MVSYGFMNGVYGERQASDSEHKQNGGVGNSGQFRKFMQA